VSVAGRIALVLAVIVPLAVLTAPPVRADGNGGAETISVTIPASANVTCSKGGVRLGNLPRVHRGNHLHCTAIGFHAHEQVRITVHSADNDLGTVAADASATATFDFTVPDDLAFGRHMLTFTGATSHLVASYQFVVVNGHAGASPGGGSLASTGADILGLLRGALVLIAAGALCYAAGRRQQSERV
jgi:hypothetical protein